VDPRLSVSEDPTEKKSWERSGGTSAIRSGTISEMSTPEEISENQTESRQTRCSVEVGQDPGSEPVGIRGTRLKKTNPSRSWDLGGTGVVQSHRKG